MDQGAVVADDELHVDARREIVRSSWQFSSFCHFSSVFRSILALPNYSPGDLEHELVAPNQITLLPELLWKLTHIGDDRARSRNLKAEGFPNWEVDLARTLDGLATEDEPNVLKGDITYQSLAIRTKLDMLHGLCCRALDISEGIINLCNESPYEVKAEPLGYDAAGTAYFRFSDDAWVFTEALPPVPKSKKRKGADDDPPVWGVASTCLSELNDLIGMLESTKNTKQRNLVAFFIDRIVPGLEAAEKSRAKLEYKKQVLSFMPRRQSSRVQQKTQEEEEFAAIQASIEEEARQREEARHEEEMERARELRAERRQQAMEEEKMAIEEALQTSLEPVEPTNIRIPKSFLSRKAPTVRTAPQSAPVVADGMYSVAAAGDEPQVADWSAEQFEQISVSPGASVMDEENDIDLGTYNDLCLSDVVMEAVDAPQEEHISAHVIGDPSPRYEPEPEEASPSPVDLSDGCPAYSAVAATHADSAVDANMSSSQGDMFVNQVDAGSTFTSTTHLVRRNSYRDAVSAPSRSQSLSPHRSQSRSRSPPARPSSVQSASQSYGADRCADIVVRLHDQHEPQDVIAFHQTIGSPLGSNSQSFASTVLSVETRATEISTQHAHHITALPGTTTTSPHKDNKPPTCS